MRNSPSRRSSWLVILGLLGSVGGCGGDAQDPMTPDEGDSEAAVPARSVGQLVGFASGSCPPELAGGNAECATPTVQCAELPDVTAQMRITGQGTRGTILLTTGGRGRVLYSVGGEDPEEGVEHIRAMLSELLDDGYRLVEVAWLPGHWDLPEGHTPPPGTVTLGCRFATVARWTYDELHDGGLFAAQGNSGGATQIALALAYYGLHDVLDLTNLGAGPLPCPMAVAGVVNAPDQRRCMGGPGVWDAAAEPILSGDPLLEYPSTRVRQFVGNDDPTPTPTQSAVIFYDAITADKSFLVVPRTGHGVHRTPEGTRVLLEAIREAAADVGG